MSISGLTFTPPKFPCSMVNARGSSSLRRTVSPSNCNDIFREKVCFVSHIDRKYLTVHGHSIIRPGKMKSTVYAAFGDMADDSTVVFLQSSNILSDPRINIKDPYKRLGISRSSSEEEIQAARNFLINKYGGHKPSVDAIESAHDRIIMQSFHDRKNPKINLKKKVREVSQSRVVKAVTSRFETPAVNFITKTAITFLVLGVLTVLFPTEEGPTLQVAISLIASIYFMRSRLE